MKTEGPVDTDVGCILLCPRNSEADFALELVKKVGATVKTDGWDDDYDREVSPAAFVN